MSSGKEREQFHQFFEDFVFDKVQPLLGRILCINGVQQGFEEDDFFEEQGRVFSIMKNGIVSKQYADDRNLRFNHQGGDTGTVRIQVLRSRSEVESSYVMSDFENEIYGLIFLVNRNIIQDLGSLDLARQVATVQERIPPDLFLGIVIASSFPNKRELHKKELKNTLDHYKEAESKSSYFTDKLRNNRQILANLEDGDKRKFLEDLGKSLVPGIAVMWFLDQYSDNEFDRLYPIAEKPTNKHNRIVSKLTRLMAEANPGRTELALPIYNSRGDLLWPKQMSHDEIVSMLKEKS